MPKVESLIKYHIIAILTTIVWGTTFVSTKVLLNNDLHPAEIFLFRFALAYLCMLSISHKHLWSNTLKDESYMLIAGLTGGSLYFLTENTALIYSMTANVSIIVCSAPLLTTMLSILISKKRKISPMLLVGSVIAFCGVILIVMSSNSSFDLHILGNLLALSAALSWAIYQIIMKGLSDRYGTLFLTRKVFFYGVITIIMYIYFMSEPIQFEKLKDPIVLANLIFLGIIATFLCFLIWTKILNKLGSVRSANYIYINPISTLLTSYIFLNELPTLQSLLGAALILTGISFVERDKTF